MVLTNIEVIEKDIVIKTTIVKESIDLNLLRNEIKDIKNKIGKIPKEKNIPDEETLRFWNESVSGGEIIMFETELIEKQKLLNELEKLK